MLWLPGIKRAAGEISTAETSHDLLVTVLQHPLVVSATRAFQQQAVRVLRAPAEGKGQEGHGGDAEAVPRLVYVGQREQATGLPNKLEVMGTDELTTCMGVVLRNPVNCRTSVGHLDTPSCVVCGLDSMVASLQAQPSTRIEVHLVGNFDDSGSWEASCRSSSQAPASARPSEKASRLDRYLPASRLHRDAGSTQSGEPSLAQGQVGSDAREEVLWEPLEGIADGGGRRGKVDSKVAPAPGGCSWPLAAAVLRHLHQLPHKFCVHTCCILSLNTRRDENGAAGPLVRGIAVEPQSGKVQPARFTPEARAPDGAVRAVCIMGAPPSRRWQGTLMHFYDTEADTWRIGPCRYTNTAAWASAVLGLSDAELLRTYSTSPEAESCDFVPSAREHLQFMRDYPRWRDTFPGDAPRTFVRDSLGGWVREPTPRGPAVPLDAGADERRSQLQRSDKKHKFEDSTHLSKAIVQAS